MNIYCSALLLLSGLMPMMALTASASTSHGFTGLAPSTTQQALPEPVDRADPGMCRADEEIVAS
ncbi:hypothetical protein [Pseudomonas sp. RA_35y_Pfl2_P32]|uniref:hypothetical protein n=1 Tax=Pseudomonas sp. RA_35y_Pfl2_P32 TaxID=3088705 RepID=UPI0030D9D6B1